MILTLTGTNAYLIKQELQKLVRSHVGEHGDLALEKFEGEDTSFEAVQGAVQSLPFLAARKLVLLRDGAANKALCEKFADIIEATGETTDLVIVESKLDRRSAYYKLLKSKTEFRELNELDERALAGWLSSEAKSRGGTLSTKDAQLLISRLGLNQMLLSNELDKLLAYNPAITADSIYMLTEPVPQSTVFELLDAAFRGQTKRALELYADQRRQKVEPQQILAMLAWQLHILAVVKVGAQRTPETIAKEARLNPYVVRKTADLARHISLPQLKTLVARVLDTDRRLKSEALDADDALAFIIVAMKNA